MLKTNRVEGRDSMVIPLRAITEPYIPKVFSYEKRVAVPPLLDHGVLRLILIGLILETRRNLGVVLSG